MICAITLDGTDRESCFVSITIKMHRQIKADHVAVANVQLLLSHMAVKAERMKSRENNRHLIVGIFEV